MESILLNSSSCPGFPLTAFFAPLTSYFLFASTFISFYFFVVYQSGGASLFGLTGSSSRELFMADVPQNNF